MPAVMAWQRGRHGISVTRASLSNLDIMTSQKRILLVGDATPLRQSLSDHLSQTGDFEVEAAETGGDALARVSMVGFDALVAEALLPDMGARDLVRLLRDEGERCPLVLLTAPGGGLGLESEGVDVLVKPFRIGVLLALLRSRLSPSGREVDAVFVIGPYSFRPAAKLMLDQSSARTIRLTEKETAILQFLYRAGQAVTGREALLGAIWGYQAGIDTHTLETHVYRLRRKIEPDPANARILITEQGGYRLVT